MFEDRALSDDELLTKLRAQLTYCATTSDFYRQGFAKAGLDPERFTLEEFRNSEIGRASCRERV